MGFRYKSGVDGDYARQGYVYFTSQRYRWLDKEAQQKILNLCMECGGEHYQALFEFVTTDTTATAVGFKYYLDKSTLYRKVKLYYERFPERL